MSLDLSADLKCTGVYQLDGIANRFFPIRGNGNFSVQVKQLLGKVHLIVEFNGSRFITNSLIVRLSFGTVDANLENLSQSRNIFTRYRFNRVVKRRKINGFICHLKNHCKNIID